MLHADRTGGAGQKPFDQIQRDKRRVSGDSQHLRRSNLHRPLHGGKNTRQWSLIGMVVEQEMMTELPVRKLVRTYRERSH
ncbi:hypothetical protein JCM15831A_04140 [Asaia astilbis]